jgi:O-6-methylguanine DNA methyltransferase
MIGMTEKGEICRTAFLRKRKTADVLAEWSKIWPKTEFYRNPKSAVAIHSLTKHPILLVGTAFQCTVWRALAQIPFGSTRTYGDIACSIGKASASRAVGRACGANPVPFFIPCHRVVGAKGLGGFSSGLEIKKNLLKAEKASIL